MTAGEGGDPACWAHLFDDEPARDPEQAVVVDIDDIDTRGGSGAIWSLPHGGDLDANVVRLEPGGVIGSHVNDEVDVLVTIVAGCGHLLVDDTSFELHGDMLALIPKGARREVRAGAEGLTYLSIHRRRGPLAIGTKPEEAGRQVE